MTSAIFEAALDRMMAAGVPFATAKAMAVEMWQSLGWARSVLSATTDPLPANPSAGDSYIALSGQFANQIAVFGTDGVWHYSEPSVGDFAYVQDSGVYYVFDGSSWAPSTLFPLKITTITAADSPYSVLATDGTIRCDCAAGNISVVIGSGDVRANRRLVVKRIDASSAYYASISGEAVDGQDPYFIPLPNQSVTLQGNGTTMDVT